MNAWEQIFVDKIGSCREKELHYLNIDAVYMSLMSKYYFIDLNALLPLNTRRTMVKKSIAKVQNSRKKNHIDTLGKKAKILLVLWNTAHKKQNRKKNKSLHCAITGFKFVINFHWKCKQICHGSVCLLFSLFILILLYFILFVAPKFWCCWWCFFVSCSQDKWS